MKARDAIWTEIEPIYRAILVHPFVRGLTDGSLPPAAFGRYVSQNFVYLSSYARALALLAGRAIAPSDTQFFASRTVFALATEQAFSEEMIEAFGLDAESVQGAAPTPVTLAY